MAYKGYIYKSKAFLPHLSANAQQSFKVVIDSQYWTCIQDLAFNLVVIRSAALS